MLCNLSVDEETICSPSDESTEWTTYRPGYMRAASSSVFSDHSFRSAILPDTTSNILNVTPDASFPLINKPVLLLLSTNIRQNGKLKAPGSVLSAANIQKTSLGRSSTYISATPGPSPFILPEKASLSRSWPAPYRPCSLASLVPSVKASQASW